MRKEKSEEKKIIHVTKKIIIKKSENERREIATQTRDYEIPPLKE